LLRLERLIAEKIRSPHANGKASELLEGKVEETLFLLDRKLASGIGERLQNRYLDSLVALTLLFPYGYPASDLDGKETSDLDGIPWLAEISLEDLVGHGRRAAQKVAEGLARQRDRFGASLRRNGSARIVQPWQDLEDLWRLQKRGSKREITFAIFPPGGERRLPVIVYSRERVDEAGVRFSRIAPFVGHTHIFELPLKASPADTEGAEQEARVGVLNFILGFHPRDWRRTELAIFRPGRGWRYIRGEPAEVEEVLRNIGLLLPAGAEEQALAPDLEEGFRVLGVPGEWLERTLRLRAIAAAHDYPAAGQERFREHVLEGRDLQKNLSLMVYDVPRRPDARELHFHYLLNVGGILRGQLSVEPGSWESFPMWLEYDGFWKDDTGLEKDLISTQVLISAADLPGGFFNPLEQALGSLLGNDWKGRILQTTPRGTHFPVEPLLADPQTRKLFLLHLAGRSAELQAVLREQAWGHRGGPSIGSRGELAPAFGFPLVVTGELRRTLNRKRLFPTHAVQPYLDQFSKGKELPGNSALVLAEENGQPLAFFDRGFLLVRPHLSFQGKESLLEEIFLKGARLSLELDKRLADSARWPPTRYPAAGAEEPVREFESLDLFMNRYAEALARQGRLGWIEALKERNLPARVWVVPAPVAADQRQVTAYVTSEATEEQSEWELAAEERLNREKDRLQETLFNVKRLEYDTKFEKASVVIRQTGGIKPVGSHPAVITLSILPDLEELRPSWVYAVAVNESLWGRDLGPVLGVLTFQDEQGRRVHAIFA